MYDNELDLILSEHRKIIKMGEAEIQDAKRWTQKIIDDTFDELGL
jgi:hypothetical protein